MFQHYRVIFRELVFITSQSYTIISIAAVGNTIEINISRRGNKYELPEDDTIMSKHVGA
jgi:hypothetical protein